MLRAPRVAAALVSFALVGAFAACGVETEPDVDPADDVDAATDAGRSRPRGDAGSSTSPEPSLDAGADPVDADAGLTPPPPEKTGEATYYDAEGVGSCGIQFPNDYLLAAMNDEEYQKSDCGRCVAVTGPKGTVTVRILDKCPACGPGDLDLSITAFTKIADKSAGRVPIKWHFVDCPF